MLLGDPCTYFIINIIIKRFKERFFVRVLVIIHFGIHFHFYTRHVYRLSVYLICNNRYRPWKTHIGWPLIMTSNVKQKFKILIY